jgi:chromosome segregation ATPase
LSETEKASPIPPSKRQKTSEDAITAIVQRLKALEERERLLDEHSRLLDGRERRVIEDEQAVTESKKSLEEYQRNLQAQKDGTMKLLADTEAKVATLNANMSAMSSEHRYRERALVNDHRREMDNLTRQITDLSRDNERIRKERETMRHDNTVFVDQVSRLTRSERKLHEDIKGILAQKADLEKQLSRCEAALVERDERLGKLYDTNTEIESKSRHHASDMQRLQKSLDDLQTRYEQTYNELRGETDTIRSHYKAIEAKLRKENEELKHQVKISAERQQTLANGQNKQRQPPPSSNSPIEESVDQETDPWVIC